MFHAVGERASALLQDGVLEVFDHPYPTQDAKPLLVLRLLPSRLELVE